MTRRDFAFTMLALPAVSSALPAEAVASNAQVTAPKRMTDQQALETIEWLCGDDFCEEMSMRELDARSELGIAVKKLSAIYRIAHSHGHAHTCFHVHEDWRREAEQKHAAMEEGGLIVTIILGPFRGSWAKVLREQRADYSRLDSRVYAYTLELPGGWTINLPVDYVRAGHDKLS